MSNAISNAKLSSDSKRVLAAAIDSMAGNGFDFGFSQDIHFEGWAAGKVGGHLADLSNKGIIEMPYVAEPRDEGLIEPCGEAFTAEREANVEALREWREAFDADGDDDPEGGDALEAEADDADGEMCMYCGKVDDPDNMVEVRETDDDLDGFRCAGGCSKGGKVEGDLAEPTLAERMATRCAVCDGYKVVLDDDGYTVPCAACGGTGQRTAAEADAADAEYDAKVEADLERLEGPECTDHVAPFGDDEYRVERRRRDRNGRYLSSGDYVATYATRDEAEADVANRTPLTPAEYREFLGAGS